MLFISIDIRKPPMLGSNNLQQPTDKADSTTQLCSDDAFPKVILSAEKTETFY